MIDPTPTRSPKTPTEAKRVLMLGATGTIGRAATLALVERGHEVVCVVRDGSEGDPQRGEIERMLSGAEIRRADVLNPVSLRRDGVRGERFDALVSCLASRTGAPADAWAIDYKAHHHALAEARAAGVSQMTLLSAICVQKPRLAFQHAKLAFEDELVRSGLDYSIVRPTAYFKSLSGQIERLRRGKPFLIFGDGRATATKPISDRDLGRFLADRLEPDAAKNRIFPIGGPGPTITPRQQGERLFELMGRAPRFQRVPVALFSVAASVLDALGRVGPGMAEKAEFARIARYYATESMLVWDAEAGRYDADATPSYGAETLFDHYERLIGEDARVDLGAHALF